MALPIPPTNWPPRVHIRSGKYVAHGRTLPCLSAGLQAGKRGGTHWPGDNLAENFNLAQCLRTSCVNNLLSPRL